MEKKILNYTLHPISIITEDGVITVPNHGSARCSTSRKLIEYIEANGAKIPINETTFGAVTGLPEEKEDTIIIVSAILANSMRSTGRKDLYAVDVPVREGGKIVGCRALSRLTKYGE